MADYEKLELSTQILIHEAQQRGITVELLDVEDNFIRLTLGDKQEYIKQATKTSADSYIAPLIMENKEVTKQILREHGLRVPSGIMVKSAEEGIEEWEWIENQDIVVKPKMTNFGQGVTVLKGNYSENDYKEALWNAFRLDTTVLIEEYIPGREYRFLIIGEEVVGVLYREPANVVGDGIHTVRELVDEKNLDQNRGSGYRKPLERIRLDKHELDFLAFQGRTETYIPEDGKRVYLRENSNISTGGDSIDVTDDVHPSYKKIALEAAKAVGARICGADIMIQDISKKSEMESYGIIELNFNPAIHIHDFPYKGKNRKAEYRILDLLGFGQKNKQA